MLALLFLLMTSAAGREADLAAAGEGADLITSAADEDPYSLDPDQLASSSYEIPTTDYSNITWCTGVSGNLPPASMRTIDRMIQKWQGRRLTKFFVRTLKSALKNPNSRLRLLLGRAGQDPRDESFSEGAAAGQYQVQH